MYSSIPFLDILYTITCLATALGILMELIRRRPVNALRVLIIGVVAAGLELLIIGKIIYNWPLDKLIFRYITHGTQLVPYLIHEYF